jgi:hypothetical protein
MKSPLQKVRERHAALLVMAPAGTIDEDWNKEELVARQAIEKLKALAKGKSPELNKILSACLSYLKRAGALKSVLK